MFRFSGRFGLFSRFYNMPIGRRLSFIVVGISIIILVTVVYIALISTTFTLRQEATNTFVRQNNNIAGALDRRLQSVYVLLHERLAPKLTTTYHPGITITEIRDVVVDITRLENNLLLQRLVIYIPGQPIALFNFANQDGGNVLTRGILAERATPDVWFVQALDQGHFGWFGIQQDMLELSSNQLASLVVPLQDSSGETVGLISGDISPSTLSSLLRDTIAIQGDPTGGTATGYSVLMGDDGNVIATYNTRPRQANPSTVLKPVLDQTGVRDLDGTTPEQKAFAVNSVMPVVGWHFITVLADSALPALPYNTVLQILLVSALGIVALIWSINRFVGATVARPAVSLNAAAASIGGGNLGYKIPFHLQEQQDEIGTIARALEDMRLNLETLYNTLEQRVTERTAQLDIARQDAQSNERELRAVYDESLSVVNDYQLQPILKNFVQRILVLLNSDYCGVWLRRRSNEQELRLIIHTYPDDAMNNAIVRMGEGLAGTVALNATPLIVDHYSTFPRRLNLVNISSVERALCVPLMSSGQAIGAVMAGRPADASPFTENEQRLMTLFANLVAPVVRNAQLFQDLDEARHAADRANHVKTRFLASVTHELRTPLNLIINNMDFMRIGAFGEVTEEQSHRLDQTIRSAEHLLYLINDLLDVSKIEAGEMQLFIQPADLYTVLDDVLDATEMMLDKDNKRNQVRFITRIQNGLPQIPMDVRRVRQVLLNLMSNALKFTLEGEVELSIGLEHHALKVAVRDTGIGIAENERDSLFSAFERTDHAKQLAIEGTGLGLAISRYLVQQHGGELDFTSKKGEGSTFWFTLPLVTQEPGKQVMTQVMPALPRS